MNIRNKFEDTFSLLIPLFRASNNPFEYYDVTRYVRIGHFNSVRSIKSIECNLFNSKRLSLMRFFNYVAWSAYNDDKIFKSKVGLLYDLLDLITNSNESEHHIWHGDSIYLKNNYIHNKMQKGWIGALPHLRLISLLMILNEKKYEEITLALVRSIYNPVSSIFADRTSKAKYEFINPISSYLKSDTLVVHEYPQLNQPNLVVNCLLLFSAINQDLCSLKIIENNKYSQNIIKYIYQNGAYVKYSLEVENPISPAYLDLHNSITKSTSLASPSDLLMSCGYGGMAKPRLFLEKIYYRVLNGYQ